MTIAILAGGISSSFALMLEPGYSNPKGESVYFPVYNGWLATFGHRSFAVIDGQRYEMKILENVPHMFPIGETQDG